MSKLENLVHHIFLSHTYTQLVRHFLRRSSSNIWHFAIAYCVRFLFQCFGNTSNVFRRFVHCLKRIVWILNESKMKTDPMDFNCFLSQLFWNGRGFCQLLFNASIWIQKTWIYWQTNAKTQGVIKSGEQSIRQSSKRKLAIMIILEIFSIRWYYCFDIDLNFWIGQDYWKYMRECHSIRINSKDKIYLHTKKAVNWNLIGNYLPPIVINSIDVFIHFVFAWGIHYTIRVILICFIESIKTKKMLEHRRLHWYQFFNCPAKNRSGYAHMMKLYI